MNNAKAFDSALYGINERIKKQLESLDISIKEQTTEIRLRAQRPVALSSGDKILFLKANKGITENEGERLLIAEKSDIDASFRMLCGNSAFAHTQELKNGFITMRYGHRAGICGTINEQGSMQHISSINIRIAREILGVAKQVLEYYNDSGILIAGPPGSGKTTILRDLVRLVSDEKNKRVTLIDSRGELSGSYLGVAFCDLGKNTDILITQDKALGLDIAIRTMFPQVVAFDEIGNEKELKSIYNGFNCGAQIITTAHINERDDLLKRPVTASLLKSGVISLIVLLSRDFQKISILKSDDI